MLKPNSMTPGAVLMAAATVLGILSRDGLAQEATPPLRVSGASTLQPFIEKLAGNYRERHGSDLHVTAGGSNAGIRDALAGESDAGMVSRALTADERAGLQYTTVGMDTLVFIVNARNPVKELDRQTVTGLFSGKITNWNALAEWDHPVVLVNKEIGRATLDLFESYSGLQHPNRASGSAATIARDAFEIGSNMESVTLVGGLPGAVGYVSMGTANEAAAAGMPIRVLPLDGVSPEVRHVVSGAYPIQRELNLVYAERAAAVSSLLDEALSPHGQRLITELGFIPIKQ